MKFCATCKDFCGLCFEQVDLSKIDFHYCDENVEIISYLIIYTLFKKDTKFFPKLKQMCYEEAIKGFLAIRVNLIKLPLLKKFEKHRPYLTKVMNYFFEKYPLIDLKNCNEKTTDFEPFNFIYVLREICESRRHHIFKENKVIRDFCNFLDKIERKTNTTNFKCVIRYSQSTGYLFCPKQSNYNVHEVYDIFSKFDKLKNEKYMWLRIWCENYFETFIYDHVHVTDKRRKEYKQTITIDLKWSFRSITNES